MLGCETSEDTSVDYTMLSSYQKITSEISKLDKLHQQQERHHQALTGILVFFHNHMQQHLGITGHQQLALVYVIQKALLILHLL